MHKYNRLDFEETNLKPGLLAAHGDVIESLREHEALFEHHRRRLGVVRHEKEKRRRQEMLGDVIINHACWFVSVRKAACLLRRAVHAASDQEVSAHLLHSQKLLVFTLCICTDFADGARYGAGGDAADLFSDTSSATGDVSSVTSDDRSSRKSGSIHTRVSGCVTKRHVNAIANSVL